MNGAQLFALASCYLALWALIGRYYGLVYISCISVSGIKTIYNII